MMKRTLTKNILLIVIITALMITVAWSVSGPGGQTAFALVDKTGAATVADEQTTAEEEETEEIKGTIESVTNVNTGIRVTWTTDETKSGYYIYRKKGAKTNPWVKVKTIKDPTRTSWLDKKIVNGARYVYKVRSFDDQGITKNSAYMMIYRLKRPGIKTIEGTDIDKVHMRGTLNTKATGFEIKYSLSKDFTNEKIKTFKGNRVETVLRGLKAGKKYYFRIRAYYVKGDKTYYSSWSKYRSARTGDPYDAYTIPNWTYLYKQASASASFIRIWYGTEIRVLGVEKARSDGDWYRVRYNNKEYFLWVPTNGVYFNKEKNDHNYVSDSNTQLENEVIEKAMDCYNKWDMKYDYTHRAAHGVPDKDGKYPFDCSNFAAYVINSVMEKYCPAYQMSVSVLVQSQMDVLVNEGLPGELGVKLISEGKLNRSKLRPGDMLFFKTDPTDERPIDHVGIYLGGDDFIHSVKMFERYPGDPLGGVCIAPLTGYNESTYMYALRVLPASTDEIVSLEKPMVTLMDTNIYPTYKCKSGTKIGVVEEDNEVTLMYTIKREYTDDDGDIVDVVNAYIRYGDNEYGFVYDYEEKLGEPSE